MTSTAALWISFALCPYVGYVGYELAWVMQKKELEQDDWSLQLAWWWAAAEATFVFFFSSSFFFFHPSQGLRHNISHASKGPPLAAEPSPRRQCRVWHPTPSKARLALRPPPVPCAGSQGSASAAFLPRC